MGKFVRGVKSPSLPTCRLIPDSIDVRTWELCNGFLCCDSYAKQHDRASSIL